MKLFKSTASALGSLFVTSKTILFIGALVVSYKYVEFTVVYSLMYYFMNISTGEGNFMDQRIAAIVTNLHDGLSSIVFVIVSLFSEAYTGLFTMIAFCAAASVEGLMLLWTSTSSPSADRTIFAAIILLGLGSSGQKLSENFLRYQLQEKMKSKKDQDQAGTDTIRTNIWLFAPLIVGYAITLSIAYTSNDDITYEKSFRYAALIMGGTFLLFLFGSAWYRRNSSLAESNLRKIYRICKAGLLKRKSKYPIAADCYYWKDYKPNHLYSQKHGEGLQLSPKVPWLFRWLDKAAVVVNSDEESSNPEASPENQEKKGQLCMVKEVREVKSLVPMIYLCFAFFAYSLLMASANTFFVAQASSLRQVITESNTDMWILFLIADVVSRMSRFICFVISFVFRCFAKLKGMDGDRSKRKVGTITRIGFGMVCAVICSLVAWKVEVRRLADRKQGSKNTTFVLIPQFVLLGMTEGFVDGGLASLFHGHVAKSMWSFEDSFVELVCGIGKLLIIPFIFSSWVKDTVDKSRLDILYLVLGILNGVFLLGFGYYSIRYAYKNECPEDEKTGVDGKLKRVHQSDLEDSPLS